MPVSNPRPASDLSTNTLKICACVHRHDLQLDFLEAVFGCSKEMDVERLAACTVSKLGAFLWAKACVTHRREVRMLGSAALWTPQ